MGLLTSKKVVFDGRWTPGIFYFLALVLVFFHCLVTLDPDFGWRLKTGEIILKQGFPRTDPFSYTMPSFAFVDHAWLVDVGMAWIYPVMGKIGLALVFSLMAFLTLGLVCGRKAILVLVAAVLVLPFVGIRAQVVGWLVFAMLMRWFWDRGVWEKWRKFVPLLFLLWANLHGSFPFGLAVLAIRAGFGFFKEKKLNDFYILIAAFAATFINPYGIGVWREILATGFDMSLRWSIMEWSPFFLSAPSFLILGLMVFVGFFIVRYRKRVSGEEVLVVFFFFAQAMSSVRHLPMWLVVALPFAKKLAGLFKEEVRTGGKEGARVRWEKAKRWVAVGGVTVAFLEAIPTQIAAVSLSESGYYPGEAVNFLRNDLPSGQIFSDYNWGGYLIWKLPEKKVFIDGRMPSWKTNLRVVGESDNAFGDYGNLLLGKIDIQAEFNKYGVDTVLWPKPGLVNPIAGFLGKVVNSLKFGVGGKEAFEFRLDQKLQELGWVRVYEDKVAVVYKRP